MDVAVDDAGSTSSPEASISRVASSSRATRRCVSGAARAMRGSVTTVPATSKIS